MDSSTKIKTSKTPLWLWPNLLGLDAPIVAISWQWLFAHSFKIDLPFTIHLVLGLSAWCVYLADRLIDVRKNNFNDFETDRHRFTRRNFKPLLIALLIAAVVNLALIITTIPKILVFSGIVTAALVGIYYLIRFFASTTALTILPREILCGMLFALGSAIGPHAYAPVELDEFAYLIPVAFFGTLCSVSCILISIWERSADMANSDNSFGSIHPFLAKSFSSGLTSLTLIATAMAFFSTTELFVAIAISSLSLRITVQLDRRLSQSMLRVLADALLLSPLLILIWSLF
ncbi:MAG: hypothetical protein AB8D78_00120 [Akkermansiaceae bacterium]